RKCPEVALLVGSARQRRGTEGWFDCRAASTGSPPVAKAGRIIGWREAPAAGRVIAPSYGRGGGRICSGDDTSTEAVRQDSARLAAALAAAMQQQSRSKLSRPPRRRLASTGPSFPGAALTFLRARRQARRGRPCNALLAKDPAQAEVQNATIAIAC